MSIGRLWRILYGKSWLGMGALYHDGCEEEDIVFKELDSV